MPKPGYSFPLKTIHCARCGRAMSGKYDDRTVCSDCRAARVRRSQVSAIRWEMEHHPDWEWRASSEEEAVGETHHAGYDPLDLVEPGVFVSDLHGAWHQLCSLGIAYRLQAEIDAAEAARNGLDLL